MKRILSPVLPGICLFIIAFVFSLFIYKDYGVSFDEGSQRQIGLVSYKYVFEGDKELPTYIERDHGVGFELPLVIIEKALKLTDTRDIYLMRHIVSHVFFLIGVFFGYLLVLRLFRQQTIACLGFLLLLLHPRLYVHSYFNSKDIPFLAVFIIALYLAQLAFEKRKLFYFLLLGIVCGYATSIRITGILLVASLGLFLLVDFITAIVKKEKIVKPTGSGLFFVLGFCASLYAAWPTLWPDPVKNFIECYNSLAHFRWEGCLVFDGNNMLGVDAPHTYLPKWFAITVPLILLASGIAGIVWVGISFLKEPLKYITNIHERQFLLYAMCFVAPFVMIILLDSVVYDDWRHVYFVYPPFILLVLFTLNKLVQTKVAIAVWGIYAVQVLLLIIFMVSAHPHQQVYFNHLVSHDDEYLRKHYDFDYWGASYKQAFEYLLAHDSSDSIKVLFSYQPVINNWEFLPEQDRKRVVLADRRPDATYFITGFRCHPGDYEEHKVIYRDIRLLNSTVVRIYKTK